MGRFQRRRQFSQPVGEFVFRAPLAASVMHHDHEQRLVGGQHHPADTAQHRHQLAIGTPYAAVRLDTVGPAEGGLLPERHVFRCGRQAQHVLAAQAGDIDIEQVPTSGIRGDDSQALWINQPDRVGQALDECTRWHQPGIDGPLIQRVRGDKRIASARTTRRPHRCRHRGAGRRAARDPHASVPPFWIGSKK